MILLAAIFLPIILGFLVIIAKRWVWLISLMTAIIISILSVIIFSSGTVKAGYDLMIRKGIYVEFSLRSYNFSSFILVSAAFFSLLIIIYSLRYMKRSKALHLYYGNILLALGSAAGVVLSGDLVTLLFFWAISGFILHNLLFTEGLDGKEPSRRLFHIVLGTDALMVLGAGIIWRLAGTFDLSSIHLSLRGWLEITAFLLLVAGPLAKTGAIPFSSWIPDCSENSSIPAMAYLPVALDKLIGVYFLVRIVLDLFVVIPNSFVSLLLLAVGSLTIVTAVFAALVQHDLKKLLSFHTVSQVGYIILGIGTGLPIGIAGGIFHMFNNVVYKSCLFLIGGAVLRKTGTTELDDLGGLAKTMPIIFVSFLTAALAISGIPPLNGFASKWMIYQSLIQLGRGGNPLWIIWLLAAMFGSALTLASFLKVLNAVFMGELRSSRRGPSEAPFSMWLPVAILAALCLVIGVFAFPIHLKDFVPSAVSTAFLSGSWSPIPATVLLLIGLAVGFLIYFVGLRRPIRHSTPFISGELIAPEKLRVTGVQFYDTIKEIHLGKGLYEKWNKGMADLYRQAESLFTSVKRRKNRA